MNVYPELYIANIHIFDCSFCEKHSLPSTYSSSVTVYLLFFKVQNYVQSLYLPRGQCHRPLPQLPCLLPHSLKTALQNYPWTAVACCLLQTIPFRIPSTRIALGEFQCPKAITSLYHLVLCGCHPSELCFPTGYCTATSKHISHYGIMVTDIYPLQLNLICAQKAFCVNVLIILMHFWALCRCVFELW